MNFPISKSGMFVLLGSFLIQRVALSAPVNMPSYDENIEKLVLPNVNVEGQLYGSAELKHEGNGVFALTVVPKPSTSSPGIAYANYSRGTLNLASVMVGSHRYANAQFRLNAQGKFVLASLQAPLPVFSTSYENKNAIAFDNTSVPTLRALGIPKPIATETDSVDRSIAFGDFFQEGRYAAFVMAANSDGVWGQGISNIPGIGHFLSLDGNGKWKDRSDELFKTMEDRMGCISPSYTAVADFNNDGRPDVFVACTGFDFIIPGATPEQNEAAGRSIQVLYASQPDGSYKGMKLESLGPIYGHKAAALDINGDANIDIVTVDPIDKAQPIGCGAPYVLLGRGDGTFTKDSSFIDQALLRKKLQFCGMFNVDVIPVDGRQDMFLAGQANDGNDNAVHAVLWAKGVKNGFDIANAKLLRLPIEPLTNSQFLFPLDIIYDEKSRTLLMRATASKFDKGTTWGTLVFDGNGNFVKVLDSWLNATANPLPTSPQFKPSFASPGFVVPFTGGCASDTTKGACGYKVPMN